MKILELGKFYAPERGGIETLLRVCSEGFTRAGHQVDCVVAHKRRKPQSEIQAGVRVHRLASYGMALSTSLAPQYLTATRQFPADIWHAHFPNPLADIACVLGPRQVPLVLHWHSEVVRQKSLMRFYAPLLLKRLLRRADRIVVATPKHLEHSPTLAPYREKVVVIPYGLELDQFTPNSETLALAAKFRRDAQERGKKVLLNIGRLVPYKGQRYAIEAMRDVDAELWLAGDGPLREDLRSLATQIGVSHKVRFWGDVSDTDLLALLHACDVFVFPSITTNEAFGLALVEAMACRKPLVVCNLASGVSYVCADNVNGLQCPPGDVAALAQAINRLLNVPELALRLGQSGRERAEREFSAPVMVKRLLDLFNQLTSTLRTA